MHKFVWFKEILFESKKIFFECRSFRTFGKFWNRYIYTIHSTYINNLFNTFKYVIHNNCINKWRYICINVLLVNLHFIFVPIILWVTKNISTWILILYMVSFCTWKFQHSKEVYPISVIKFKWAWSKLA